MIFIRGCREREAGRQGTGFDSCRLFQEYVQPTADYSTYIHIITGSTTEHHINI